MSSVPPQWVIRAVECAIDVLGLGDQEIRIRMMACIDNDEGLMGQAEVQPRRLLADILLKDNIREDDEGYITITHEMLHVTQGDQQFAARRIIEQLPKRERVSAMNRWKDANEQTTERIARALAPFIKRFVVAAPVPTPGVVEEPPVQIEPPQVPYLPKG